MTDTSGDLPASLKDYFDRSNVALALSDGAGDVPLALVNRAFCELTGYARDEVEGRNCRFLQGPGTPETQKARLHAFIRDGSRDAGRFPILNHRKDGTAFHNFVFMTRLRDPSGATRFVLASQFDMTPVLNRAALHENDRQLASDLADIDRLAKDYGLAMIGSAGIIAESVALLAKLSMEDG